ncbi:hypothetical protein [Actinoalloteichus hymeniacidonis]|uniref:MFS transporter n=1 Tax=Actinoalloteichus hymeniacidonis TaxID=340345 RepID=A0AAC9HR11_9PSEU|nr:hypothetical protein [Actinoalloteichus hymeniacidonis]AOS63997.1 hypothetical protein TL08_15975 [Actinoalloteichus hymeniacidonis]MBB5907944.1 hypothetical protein [Actinoalloteichus hymeniacidonis]
MSWRHSAVITTSALGFGHVLAVMSPVGIMTSGVSHADRGLTGGLAPTAQHIGSAVGVAVLPAVVASATITEGVTAEAGSLTGLRA